jgi:hypothetical protein
LFLNSCHGSKRTGGIDRNQDYQSYKVEWEEAAEGCENFRIDDKGAR